ncbi:hypothetical protein COV88_02110 [Candidatus Saccharibacteria bacterium CG11_big_fil_rev_8_21_14_0_20_41_19]|nr:MAG: hypothetical protein COV88_02110 [Candidatus Saccharibacteria bacterium CG11_big_fil_rev_8_21_14_0_20_41_19]PIZ61168.1 MAG: hypothetical protein COY18_00095 [Candidatus Saccharibacteria bacterium CG_4_10_14_0_2_um_filter_41_11]PJC29986.1 MAG: hypothetical protein CO052_00490 [Candidatus Saccharibacteria bacterium CG_4_9_14_0_2_um_filter_41_9]PJE65840.1 MAG: hypothetical protein COU92_03785 [Candidatus Saccharibacteria bacterium CG10_big_fil_rev_8_21_14_0_10_41_32]
METNMTKIMLVEDDKSLREIYGIRLIAEGYDIKSAGDGEEALAMAIKERPDLIISDVMMPKISGFDMLDILRATPETKDIKIIMMTALSSEDQRARGESLGANRYLVKSQVGIEDVVRTVHDVLADAPTAAAPTASQLFGAPASSATVANPQSFSLPARPMSAPTPTAAPAPAQATSTPAAPTTVYTPEPSVQPSMMPQPTAPFSSPAPASLGAQMTSPVQQPAPAPAPVVNLSQPFTPPPVMPTPMPEPKPVITAPNIDMSPQPAPTYAPTPVITSAPAPISAPTPATASTPFQDVIAPQPSTTSAPDIAALIAQELNNRPAAAPQNPVQ